MQGLHSPSLHTQRQLKEALYNQIIDYFDQGKVSTAGRAPRQPPSAHPASRSCAVSRQSRLPGHRCLLLRAPSLSTAHPPSLLLWWGWGCPAVSPGWTVHPTAT